MSDSQYSNAKYKRCCDYNSSGSDCPQFRKRKRSRISVKFSPNVTLRCFFHDSPQLQLQDANPSLWLKKGEVDKIRSRANALSRLHYRARLSANTQASSHTSTTSGISDATRYTIKGESLRGLEHITDSDNGRKRQRVKEEAMQAVAIEQQEQLIQHVLESATVDQAKNQAMKMDISKLAKVYSSKTAEALVYAKEFAKEDAKVAAAILAEDMPVESASHSSNTGCSPSLKDCFSTEISDATVKTPVTHSERIKVSIPQHVLVIEV